MEVNEAVQAILNSNITLPNGTTKKVKDVLADLRELTYGGYKLRSESSARDDQVYTKLSAVKTAAQALGADTQQVLDLVAAAVETALVTKGVNVTVEIRRSSQE